MKRFMLMGCALMMAAGAFAQAAGSSEQPAVQAASMSLKQAWEYGGWIMWVLGAISILALAMVLYFLGALRLGAIVPRALLTDVLAKIRKGELDDVHRLCDRRPCALSSVVLTALETLRNVPQCDVALLRDAVESEGAREAESIQGQTEFLLDIATIAPLLGLLGTVLGMLTAFGSVATNVANAKPVVLAAGVSQALVTTIFGLFVAIPSMACYAWFRRRAVKQVARLEAATSEVVTAIIGMGAR
ncbi:MAG: MotA/TolQ/ExbB proton channel family protein [Kiritimatiellae bacterium]|nr:MotA/TolQ/ExbB proton channel family protein [Kiritimatiellia bacterium]